MVKFDKASERSVLESPFSAIRHIWHIRVSAGNVLPIFEADPTGKQQSVCCAATEQPDPCLEICTILLNLGVVHWVFICEGTLFLEQSWLALNCFISSKAD